MRGMIRIGSITFSCLLMVALGGCANQPHPDLVGRTSGDGNRHYQPQAVECEKAAESKEAETDKPECAPPEQVEEPSEAAYPD